MKEQRGGGDFKSSYGGQATKRRGIFYVEGVDPSRYHVFVPWLEAVNCKCRSRCFLLTFKTEVLKDFAKFTRKHLLERISYMSLLGLS